MLSIETEARVAKIFLSIVDGEKAVELSRRVLAGNLDFDAWQIFKRIDKEGKNYIDEYNLVDFLKLNSVYCTLDEARFIILFYDSDYNERLSYSEFLNLVLSETDYALKRISRDRMGSSYSRLTPPYDVEFSVSKVLEKELDLVRNLDLLIKELKLRYDFNVYDLYSSMQTYSSLSAENVRLFFERSRVDYSEADIKAIMKRLDINTDGRIAFEEFKRFFSFPILTKVNDYESYKLNKIINMSSTYTSKFRACSPLRMTGQIEPVEAKTYTYSTYSPEPRRLSPNISLRLSPERRFSPNRTYRYSPIRFSPKRNVEGNFSTKSPITRSRLNISTEKIELPESKVSNISTYSPKRYTYLSNDEDTFVSFLRAMMEAETEIEKAKSNLVLRADFNVEDAFRVFELDGRGFISDLDLKYGLNLLDIAATSDEINLLMKRFDLKGAGVLAYADFFDMVTPFDKDYRNMVESRLPSSYIPKYNRADVFIATTKLYLSSLFKLLISTEHRLEGFRQKLSRVLRFDLRLIFPKMDRMDLGYINNVDLATYLQRSGLVFIPKETDLLFIRLDRNRDERVVYSEVFEETIPRSSY